MLNSLPQNPAPQPKPQPIGSEGQFDQNKPINADLLHEELQAALGTKYVSSDTGVPVKVGFSQKQVILVRLTADATDADKAKADQVVAAHDATKLSKHQQKDKTRTDALARLATADFTALRGLKDQAQMDGVINILEDLVKVLHKEA